MGKRESKKYSILRDESGYAKAIVEGDFVVLQLNPGTERNEQEVERIVSVLNAKFEQYKKTELVRAILRRASNDNVGYTMARACELLMRLRGGQMSIVRDILESLIPIGYENKLHTGAADDYAQWGWELGELLRCYAKYKKCSQPESCWLTRRGFGTCENEKKESEVHGKKEVV